MSEEKIPAKWLTCDGRHLKKLAQAGLVWLEHNHQHVNALNVFPVPDGDTGTNMLLTMRSALKRIQDSDEAHAGKMAAQLAQGALMGARGNSGVILSQIWRGFARSIRESGSFDAQGLAQALQEAAATAYGGVMKPVEGTILTVIKAGAEEAVDAAKKSQDLRFVLERVLERCQQTLERTPDMLPILKQAGVVDSGGQGLVYVLEGMLRYVNKKMPKNVLEMSADGASAAAASAARTAPAPQPAQAHAVPEGGSLENPYDVQFILMGRDLDVLKVRRTIDSMGDSTVVVGDESTIKVHVHVKDPGQPISYGISLGAITDVVIENMQEQMEQIVGNEGNGLVAAPTPPALAIEPGQIGVIAVAPGPGLADVFHSLGVAFVVDGGQTNNPSTEEIFQAIQDVPTDKIIILPNNKNIFLAAEAARDLSPKHVVVIPSRTVPQGIAAMLYLDADGDLEGVAAAMKEATNDIATGEITTATRSVTIDDVDVEEGHTIGLANGRLCASGLDMLAVLTETLAQMDIEERELVSIYYGADVPQSDAEAIASQIEAWYPDVETEVISGGQPYYYYILGAE